LRRTQISGLRSLCPKISGQEKLGPKRRQIEKKKKYCSLLFLKEKRVFVGMSPKIYGQENQENGIPIESFKKINKRARLFIFQFQVEKTSYSIDGLKYEVIGLEYRKANSKCQINSIQILYVVNSQGCISKIGKGLQGVKFEVQTK